MADINHTFVEQTTEQTHTGDLVYTDITGASIASGNFTAGKKYLIVTNAQVGGSSTGEAFGIQTLHGSTAFAESEYVFEPIQIASDEYQKSYTWFTVWTAIASEGIKLQFKTFGSGETVKADQITMTAIELTEFTENTDWLFDFNTTNTALTTTFSASNNASLTFTPAEVSDWLVLSYDTIEPGNTEQYESRIETTGGITSSQPTTSVEGETDTGSGEIDKFNDFITRAFSLTAVSHTFTQQARNADSSGGSRTNSAIFAINLDKFRNHSFAYTEAEVAGTGGTSEIQTTSITPLTTNDHWIGSFFTFNPDATASQTGARMQVDNVDQPPTQTSDDYFAIGVWDSMDLAPFFIQSIDSLDTSAHDIDLDVFKTDAGLAYGNRFIFAVQMQTEADTFTEDFTVDALLQATQTEPFTVDALLQVTQTEVFLVDSFLQATQTKPFLIDAFLQATQQTKTFLVDSIVVNRNAETFDVDAFPQAQQTFNFTVDGLREASPEKMYLLDAFLQETFTEDFDVDAFPQATQVKVFTVDSSLVRIERFNVDAKIVRIVRFDIDARIAGAERFNVDAIVVDRNTEVFDVDSFLQDTFTEDFLIDSQIEPQKLFCDFFNRPNSITLGASDIPGNVWVETETVPGVGPEIVSNKMGWLSVQNANNRNEPIAENTFTKQTSGKLKWQFQFDFDRGSDNDFRLTMQLGDGSLMVNPNISHTTGVAVNLQYASTSRGMTAQAGFGHGFEPSLVQVARTKGLLTVDITVDFGSQTYIINIDGPGFLNGTKVTTGIPFVNGVDIDTIRIYSDLLSAIAFNTKTFDDMCVFKVFETTQSFSVDAILKATFQKGFTVDALLQKEQVFNFSVDSLLSQGFMKMFLIDAFIQEQQTEVFDIDAEIAIRVPENYNVDARLRLRATENFIVDSLLKAVQTEDFTVDALLAETKTKTFTVDTFNLEANVKLFTINAFLKALGQTEGFTIDSRIAQINTETFTVDATNLFLTQTKDFTVDSLLKVLGQVDNFIVDSFVFDGQVKNVLVDSLLRKEQTETFTIQAELAFTATEVFDVDSLLKEEGNTETFTIDTILQVRKTFKIDGRVVRAGQASVDALLKGQKTKDFTVNALVFIPPARLICVQAILIDRNTATFDIDARIVNRFTKVFSVDALLPETKTVEFIVDTFTAQPTTKVFTVDSILAVANTKLFIVDTLLKGQNTVEFKVDTFKLGVNVKLFPVDAKLRARQTETFTIDSLLSVSQTFDFTVDTVFKRFQFNNKTWDALIQELDVTKAFTVGVKTKGDLTESFSLDAILKGTFTNSFIVDGFPFIPPAISITVDPILLFTATETADVDAKLINRKDTSFTIDAVLAVTVTNTKDFTIDVTLQGPNTKVFTIDSKIAQPQTATFIVDTFLQRISTRSFLIDSTNLFNIFTEDFTVDSILKPVQFETFSIDSILRGVQTELFDIDAEIASRNTTTFAVDSITFILPSRSFLIHGFPAKFGQTEQFTIEAHIRFVQSKTFEVDSILSSVNVVTPFVDAFLQKLEQTEDFTVDAKLARTNTFAVDAFIQRLGINCRLGSIFRDNIDSNSGWITLEAGDSINVDGVNFPGQIEYFRLGNFFRARTAKLTDQGQGGVTTVNSFEDIKLNFKYQHESFTLGNLDGPIIMGLTDLNDTSIKIFGQRNFSVVGRGAGGQLFKMRAQMFDGTILIETGNIDIPNDVDVFVSMEKVGTLMRLNVTTDPAHLVHVPGSPTSFVSVEGLDQMIFNQLGASNTDILPFHMLETGRLDDIQVFGSICTDFNVDGSIQAAPGKQFRIDSILSFRTEFTIDALLKAIGSNRCDSEKIFEDDFLTVSTWSNEINNTGVDGWSNQRIFIDGESSSSEELLEPSDIASLNGFVRATLKPGGFLPAQTPIFKTKYRRRKLIDAGGIGKINGSKFRIEFEFENIALGAGGSPLAFNTTGLHEQDSGGPQLSFKYGGGASLVMRLTDGINAVQTSGLNWSPSNGKRLFIVGEVDGADMEFTLFNDAEHTSIHDGPVIVNVGGIQKNSLNLEWVILQSNSKFSGPSNPSTVNRIDNVNVFSSPCPTVAIDAQIQLKPIREFTVDAVIVRLEEFSIDASILDPTIVNVSEFEISSILSGSILKEFTINGLLAETNTKDVTVDGIVIRGATFSVSAVFSTIPEDLNFSLTHMQDITPLFSGIFDKTFSVDVLLSGRTDFSIDARLRLVKRFDIDAVLTTPPSPLNFSLAHMQDIVPIFNMEVILEFSVNAILSTEEIQTFTVDADLFFEQTVDYTVDSIIAVSPTNIILIDTDSLLLQKALTEDVVIDSRVVERFTEGFTVDTFSIGQAQKSFTVNSLLKKIGAFNQFEVDARLAEIKTFDFTINGILSFAGENGFCNTFPDPITIGTGFEQFTGPITPEHESEVELLIGQEFTLNNQQIRKITVLLRASDFPNEVSGTPPVFGDVSSIQGVVWSNVVKGNNSGEVIETISDNVIDADSTSGDLPPGVWKQITFEFGTTFQTQESNPFLTGNFLIGILHDVGIDINDPQGVGVAKPVISDGNVIPGEALFRRGSNTVLPNSDEWQELIGATKDMVINIEVVNGNDITEGKGQRCPTMDALIAVEPKPFTVDAILNIPEQFSFSINSLLKASLLEQTLVDSLIANDFVTNGGPTITKYYLTDSIIKAFGQKELITVDAILGEKATINKPFTIDAQIQLDNVRTRINAVLRKTQTFNIFPDAILSAINKEDYIVDGLIEGVQTVGFIVDTLLPIENTAPFIIDAQLVKQQTLDFNVDSSLFGFNSKTFTVDVLLIVSRNMFVDSIIKALGDGILGTGNNGGTNDFAENPLVDQQNGGNFFQLPLGTLVGQRLRLPTAPVRVTDYTFIMFRSNISGSPAGTITGKIYKQSIAGNPILVGDLIATSNNVINVADLTTNSIGQFVTFTFTNPPEITQDDNIFIGFEISGSNENTFIETELTGTVIDGGDLNVEFTAGIWGADLGIDTKVTINIDTVPRQRASALMTAFVGRFVETFTVDALLTQDSKTETFRVDARLTGIVPKEFTLDAVLRGTSFCIGAFVGDVFEIVLDCESVISGNTSGVSTI